MPAGFGSTASGGKAQGRIGWRGCRQIEIISMMKITVWKVKEAVAKERL